MPTSVNVPLLPGLLLGLTITMAAAEDVAPIEPSSASSDTTAVTRDERIEEEKQKLAEDPTKVVTQAGVSYGGDEFRLSGSVSLGPVNKINASANPDLSEWRAGGSWLLEFGIINVNVGKKDFDDGSTQTNYSIGTFIPFSAFHIEPWGCKLFGMAGYTYNDGEVAIRGLNDEDLAGSFDPGEINSPIFAPVTSSSGYLGVFGLKPLSEKWRLMGFLAGSIGTNDFSGYAVGVGTGYSITKRQSLSLMAYTQDNSYGSDQQIRLTYRFQFN